MICIKENVSQVERSPVNYFTETQLKVKPVYDRYHCNESSLMYKDIEKGKICWSLALQGPAAFESKLEPMFLDSFTDTVHAVRECAIENVQVSSLTKQN